MSIDDFVEKTFGSDKKLLLQRIGCGGNSNYKGSKYENYFAVAKICSIVAESITSSNNLDDYRVTAQEIAFVDDFCYRVRTDCSKTNYQAKNSSGHAASWTNDISERCNFQRKIDVEYHGVTTSANVLLVSSRSKYRNNLKKIPIDMRTYCFCEYFPYLEGSVQLIKAHSTLRSDLEKICANNNLQTLDTAFKIIHSAWCTSDSSQNVRRTVGDIIGEAKSMSRPNIFHSTISPRTVPVWLVEKCSTFKGCDASVESGVVYVRYNGFEISVLEAPAELTSNEVIELEKITKPQDFLEFLTGIAKNNLV